MWEYKTTMTMSISDMDKMGKAGWELIQIFQRFTINYAGSAKPEETLFYWKRRL